MARANSSIENGEVEMTRSGLNDFSFLAILGATSGEFS